MEPAEQLQSKGKKQRRNIVEHDSNVSQGPVCKGEGGGGGTLQWQTEVAGG